MSGTDEKLVSELTAAAKKAFERLFAETKEHFYFCALATHTGEGKPFIVAWSEEAWDRLVAAKNNDRDECRESRWVYHESPYLEYGSDCFDTVEQLLAQRVSIFDDNLSLDEVDEEYYARIDMLESAMRRLDDLGVFGSGEERLSKVLSVVIPNDDDLSVEITRRLNPDDALEEYLLYI